MGTDDWFVENMAEQLQLSSGLNLNRALAKKILPLDRIQELYGRVKTSDSRLWFERLLKEMRVSFHVSETDLRRVPKTGTVLAVANHPYGILDGAALGALLCRVRPDVKLMTNILLNSVAELHDHCIFVDPFGRKESAERNRLALKEALLWLNQGHMLAVFPAGEVSHLQLSKGGIADPQWNPIIARLARRTGAAALPVFFRGGNSIAFHAIGLLHPHLRTAWLMHEFLSQKGKTLEVRIGTAIPGSTIANMSRDDEATEYLRRRTYLLSHRSHKAIPLKPTTKLPFPRKRDEMIAPGMETQRLVDEIQQLNSGHLVEDTREFSVYVARAAEIPCLLQEIGRLREVTFREVGEGSGRSRDLDEFDNYYLHLFLWDKRNARVAGAYRMGICPEILADRGPRGLYTSTLFHYQPEFFENLGPALELGRSFVVPEYQRKFAPLLLLWKGIGCYIVGHPETPVLFGAVSISRLYNSASRELIFKYFESRRREAISQFVRPRRPFRPLPFQPWASASTSHILRDVDDLGDSVSDLESDAKGIPILVRQYLKLGGTLLAFNVDRKFSDVLDGLVFLDLRKTDSAALERYMGAEGLERFRRHHAAGPCQLPVSMQAQPPSLYV